jgi:hypothetical protein
MAIFNESGNGGKIAGGCAVITYIKTYRTAFAAGDIVFNIDKATKGVLERIVIKRPKIINSARTGGHFEAMYVDTLNALWNEWDLVSHAEAIILVQLYYEELLEEAAALARC